MFKVDSEDSTLSQVKALHGKHSAQDMSRVVQRHMHLLLKLCRQPGDKKNRTLKTIYIGLNIFYCDWNTKY